MGVIPVLVKLLGIHSHNAALTEMCLIAFGNLAELGGYNLPTDHQVLALYWPTNLPLLAPPAFFAICTGKGGNVESGSRKTQGISLLFNPEPEGSVLAPWDLNPLLCSVSESSKEEFASTSIADELVRLFQKQTEHEKKEMVFEVLAPLAENGNMILFVCGN